MRSRLGAFAVSWLAAIGGCSLATLAGVSAQGAGSQLERIATDAALWGEDGLAVVAAIGHWQRIGEATIVIYTDKVVAGSRFAKADEATRATTRFVEEMRRPLPALRRGEPDALARASTARAGRLKADALKLIEDDSFRLAVRSEGGIFLRPDVSIASVVARYGKAQKVTTEVVHAQGERRPAILTIHEYAEGAVRFAESDLAAPGIVDRVYLDTRAVARELYAAQP